MLTTPHLDSHNATDPKPEILSAFLAVNRRNVCGITHVQVCRKDNIFRQRLLNHNGVGGGIAYRRVYPTRAYSTVLVLVSFLSQLSLSPLQTKSLHDGCRLGWGAHLLQPCCDFFSLMSESKNVIHLTPPPVQMCPRPDLIFATKKRSCKISTNTSYLCNTWQWASILTKSGKIKPIYITPVFVNKLLGGNFLI